jgi:hypothetical protein
LAFLNDVLADIEYRILRYRSGKGSFPALIKDLDGFTLAIEHDASVGLTLRSRWRDLEEIAMAAQAAGQSRPPADQLRMADMVLDEVLEIASTVR